MNVQCKEFPDINPLQTRKAYLFKMLYIYQWVPMAEGHRKFRPPISTGIPPSDQRRARADLHPSSVRDGRTHGLIRPVTPFFTSAIPGLRSALECPNLISSNSFAHRLGTGNSALRLAPGPVCDGPELRHGQIREFIYKILLRFPSLDQGLPTVGGLTRLGFM